MIIEHGEHRPLMSWLMMQERVIRLWIDEIIATAGAEIDLIEKLEEHHDWLAARIDELTECRDS